MRARLHDIIAHLAARGLETEPPSSPDDSEDFWTAWLTDPDGYRIELVQWPVGHPDGMTHADLEGPETRRVSERSAKDVVGEMFRRQQVTTPRSITFVAVEMSIMRPVPRSRGLKAILRTIDADLGPIVVEQHHLSSAKAIWSPNTSRCTGTTEAPRCRCWPTRPSPAVRRRVRSSTYGESLTE